MAFCRKCGKEIADGDRFCPYCGDATGVQQGPASAAGDWNQAEMMR
ncbi:MAG: zinc ribbon domain-containing protein, partial [Clostridiales bacterium]